MPDLRRLRSVEAPVSPEAAYVVGLVTGLVLGVPVGLLLAFRGVPAAVDRLQALFVGHDRRA